jgi:NADH-quinone oxidoreductase subunit J
MDALDQATVTSLVFYLFAGTLLFSAMMVLVARSSAHAVLFLILAFFNAAGLFVLLGAELLAMTLVIVYVGAVAVLFLFVVMMLDVDSKSHHKLSRSFKGMGIFIGSLLSFELLVVMMGWKIMPEALSIARHPIPAPEKEVSNVLALGHILYTDYGVLFQIAGVILLLAMIGAIVLTLRERPDVRRQDIQDQLDRHPSDTLEIRSVEVGKGIS